MKMIRAVAVCLGLVLPLAGAGLAHADTSRFSDAHDDTPTSADIWAVRVDNSDTKPGKVIVTVWQDEIRDGDYVEIYFDTRRLNPGPEYKFGGGVGSEYGYGSMKTWKERDRFLTSCSNTLQAGLNVQKDFVRVAVPRSCLGDPGKVRVAVHLTRGWSPATLTHDWAKARRTWLPWVSKG